MESGEPRGHRSRIEQVVPDDAGKIAFEDSGVKSVRVLDSPCRPSRFIVSALGVLDEAIGQTSIANISVKSRGPFPFISSSKVRRGKSNENFENSAEAPTEVRANRATFLTAPLRISQVLFLKRRFDRALFLMVMTMAAETCPPTVQVLILFTSVTFLTAQCGSPRMTPRCIKVSGGEGRSDQ